jgi:pyridoxamine 5'-phosphate oxidase
VSDGDNHPVSGVDALRAELSAAGLDVGDLDADPFVQFEHWLDAAMAAGLHEPTAMVLATATGQGVPDGRMVLLKGVHDGAFWFFTNYGSAKASDLDHNGRAALVFPWHELARQVRVSGQAVRLSDAASDAYWATRPRGAQIGAWASPQSEVIVSRTSLDQARVEADRRHLGRDVPRPPFWGGYRVIAERIEFWQGRPDRLHDRLRYRLDASRWVIERLAP